MSHTVGQHSDDEMYGDNFKALMVCNLDAGPTHV